MESESVVTTNVRQMTSVRFANAVLDNIGASVSLGKHSSQRSFESIERSRANATLDEVVSNPLAIGLVEDILCTRQEAIDDENFVYVFLAPPIIL